MDKQTIDTIDLAPGNYDATTISAEGDGQTYDFTFEVKSLIDPNFHKTLNVNLRAFHDPSSPQKYLRFITWDKKPDAKGVSFTAYLPNGYFSVLTFIKEKNLKALKASS